MKKSLVLALVASFLMAGTASAEIPNPLDLKLDGSVTVQYRNDKVTSYNVGVASAPVNHNGFKILGVLNADKKLSDNVSLYGRITYETLTNDLVATNYPSAKDYAGDYNGVAIDAFGLKIKGDWNWTIGSQALTIGQGLVYDNGFIGKHALPYAINGSGKMGVVETNVFWARTNYQKGNNVLGNPIKNDTFYGVQLGYDVSSKVNVGGFYTKLSLGNTDVVAAANLLYPNLQLKNDYSFYGINTLIKMDDKVSFNAEYAKSNANTDNKAYQLGLTYAINKKSKIGFTAYRVEDLANIYDGNFGGMTTGPAANTKGYIFSYSNKIGSDTTLNVTYDSYKAIKHTTANDLVVTGNDNDRNRTRVGLTFVF